MSLKNLIFISDTKICLIWYYYFFIIPKCRTINCPFLMLPTSGYQQYLQKNYCYPSKMWRKDRWRGEGASPPVPSGWGSWKPACCILPWPWKASKLLQNGCWRRRRRRCFAGGKTERHLVLKRRKLIDVLLADSLWSFFTCRYNQTCVDDRLWTTNTRQQRPAFAWPNQIK